MSVEKETCDICIVGFKCKDILTGVENPEYLGGCEQNLVALARGLVKEGMSVTLVVYDDDSSSPIEIDHIKVIKAFSTKYSGGGLRSIVQRISKLRSALRAANARAYMQMGAGSETGFVVLALRSIGFAKRPFIFLAASDSDVDPTLPRLKGRKERYIYRYGLRRSRVAAQTCNQQQALATHFGIDSTVIPMSTTNGGNAVDMQKLGDRRRVVWIGRIIQVKRLEILLEVARDCPDIEFDVVGTPNRNSQYADDLMKQAECCKNVCLHGRLGPSDIKKLYLSAAVLLCTSSLEGFPTTFIEAWSYGVPVVTTFDPDGLVASANLGLVVSDTNTIASALRELLEDDDQRLILAAVARDYFLKNHSSGAVVRKFLDFYGYVTGITRLPV